MRRHCSVLSFSSCICLRSVAHSLDVPAPCKEKVCSFLLISWRCSSRSRVVLAIILLYSSRTATVTAVVRLCNISHQLHLIRRLHVLYNTYKFASPSAMLMVDLYPASICLNPSISPPMYFNFAQSRKLFFNPSECAEHLLITSSNSPQALPHRNRGSFSAFRSALLLAAVCWRD